MVIGYLRARESMNYVSTRGQIEPIAFQDAVLMGLA